MLIPPSLPPQPPSYSAGLLRVGLPVEVGLPRESFESSPAMSIPKSAAFTPSSPWSELSGPAANRSWIDGKLVEGFDLGAIRQSSSCCVQLQGAKAEDELLTAGAALALGKPTVLVVSERKQLPWFLREAEVSYPGLVQVLEGEASAQRVGQALESLQAAPLPPDRLLKEPVDSFIGCLMSGLSEQQYQEGRGHLQAISMSMKDSLEFAAPYCEGIKVGSTSTFGTPQESLVVDFEAVRRADHCVFYVYEGTPRPSGMWVEMGAALAWSKPTVLLTPNEAALPPALQGSPAGLKKVVYPDHAHLLSQLRDPQQAPSLLSP